MKDQFEDLKNIKPLPLEVIPGKGNRQELKKRSEQLTEVQLKNDIRESSNINNQINNQCREACPNQQCKPEVKQMEPLKTSKTLWGFGIAVFIYIVQNILIALNVTGPDNLIVKAVIETVIAIAGFFGVYGVRDALRKMTCY